jgi:sulfite reductase (NADPH) hemoprotein beta-component
MRGDLAESLRDESRADIAWEAEQLAKSHGVYLEFNRAQTGREKDWRYMVRVGIPGGGPILPGQWAALDRLSERFARTPEGRPTLRLTSRQNVQFHWVRKPDLLELVRTAAESELLTLNGCGDNVRNVTACPLSRGSADFDANRWARRIADRFRLPAAPFLEIFEIDASAIRGEGERFAYGPALLNRKFKIGVATVHRDAATGRLVADNCVEARAYDLAVAPIVERDRARDFQIFVGGGQGEKFGKPTTAALARPFARVAESELLETIDAVVAVHQEWGDRRNRHWARLKYVIAARGIDWFRDRVAERLGRRLAPPEPGRDIGARHLHHGWIDGGGERIAFGAFIENGRIVDGGPNGEIKSMVRALTEKYPVEILLTANQDIVFARIPREAKEDFAADLRRFGHGERDGRPVSPLRLHSGACVGLDTCRLAYTDSEKFEPELIDRLERMGWAEARESIGVTGCERQCFRPATKTIGVVGSGLNRYLFKLFGSEDGRHQGRPLSPDGGATIHLRSVPRERVADVIDAIFRFHRESAREGEDAGAFLRRIGDGRIIERLRRDATTRDLMALSENAERFEAPAREEAKCA